MTLPASCPPSHAEPRSGFFYRLVGATLNVGDVPAGDEWLLPYAKRKGDCVGRTDLCDCHSHSVFSEIEDLRAARRLVPWAAKKGIAQVLLSTDDGVLAASASELGDSHHDWWPTQPEVLPASTVVEAR